MSNYKMTVQNNGPFTVKIYPYFVHPVGAIEWAAELAMEGATVAHVTRAQSHDDARGLLEDKIKALHAHLGNVLEAYTASSAAFASLMSTARP